MDRRKGKKVRACGDGNKGKEAKMLLTDLPTGLIMEILSWLPLKSLSKCRCVSKTWSQIISDPHFAKLHLSRSAVSILIHNELPHREAGYLRLYQVVEALDRGFIQIEETIFSPRLNLPDSSFYPVDSCNGLVLLRGAEILNSLYVCNPVLGEFITIRVAEGDKRTHKGFCLGFSVKTNQYKVLHTCYIDGEGPKAELYTVGTGSWKSLANAPSCPYLALYSFRFFKFNTFLHGAYHWVEHSSRHLNDDQTSVSIFRFDFENDMFGKVPLPPRFILRGDDQLMLGVIEDSLYATCYSDDGPYGFDVWVMKDYGVKESWTKHLRIKHAWFSNELLDHCYPLILLKNGRMLMSYSDKDVVCYNLKKKRFIKTDICAKRDMFSIIAYTPCFVSLNDVAKGEQISRGGEPIN